MLRWGEADDRGGSEITGYKVLRRAQGSSFWTEASDGILQGHRYLLDTGLEPFTAYEYGVRAIDEGGNIGDVSAIFQEYTRPAVLAGWPQRMEICEHASP